MNSKLQQVWGQPATAETSPRRLRTTHQTRCSRLCIHTPIYFANPSFIPCSQLFRRHVKCASFSPTLWAHPPGRGFVSVVIFAGSWLGSFDRRRHRSHVYKLPSTYSSPCLIDKAVGPTNSTCTVHLIEENWFIAENKDHIHQVIFDA